MMGLLSLRERAAMALVAASLFLPFPSLLIVMAIKILGR